MAKVEIEVELFRDLVDAAGYVSAFYTMFLNRETPEDCGDLNATEYLASEASSIAERGRVVLTAVEHTLAVDEARCGNCGELLDYHVGDAKRGMCKNRLATKA